LDIPRSVVLILTRRIPSGGEHQVLQAVAV
jgi:hypothetical protein